jgi:hypothetical protein
MPNDGLELIALFQEIDTCIMGHAISEGLKIGDSRAICENAIEVLEGLLGELLGLFRVSDKSVRVAIDPGVILPIEEVEEIGAAGIHHRAFHFPSVETN